MPRNAEQKAANAVYMREYTAKNREEINRKQREAYAADPEAARLRTAQWREKNPEKKAAQNVRYMERYRNDPEVRKNRQQWDKESRERCKDRITARSAYRSAKRRCDLLQRTPPWANLKEIERVYMLRNWVADFTGKEYHVDHVVPLKGEFISGLHVAENLQILPATENLEKSNNWVE